MQISELMTDIKIDRNVQLTGNVLYILGPGPVRIKANQGGNDAYSPADPVSREFCINPVKPTILESDENGQIVLSSGSNTGNLWYRDGDLLTSDTGSSIIITESGTYSLQITVGTCQSEISDPYYIEISADLPIHVSGLVSYPNPANNLLTIRIPENLRDSWYMISIVDLHGRYLYRSKKAELRNGIIYLDISPLHEGIYYFILQDGTSGRQYSNSFIIER